MQITAETILATPPGKAEALVPGAADVRKALLRLAATWHPDTCTHARASDVFAHLVALRDGRGRDAAPDRQTRVFETADGRRLRTAPLSAREVDQGEVLVQGSSLVTVFPEDLGDLAEREAGIAAEFRFADQAMRDQMAPFLPRIDRRIPLADGRSMVLARRDREEILLADLVEHAGALPPVHAAWLCSGLMNIAAWMNYAGLAHGAIAPDAILVDPARHSVRLAAGWGFSVSAGTRPTALPARTLDLVPRMALDGQTAGAACDLELVRQTVREALGDPRGTAGAVFALPGPIRTWLAMPGPDDAIADYRAWQEALETGWGPRTFVDFPVRAADVYGA